MMLTHLGCFIITALVDMNMNENTNQAAYSALQQGVTLECQILTYNHGYKKVMYAFQQRT